MQVITAPEKWQTTAGQKSVFLAGSIENGKAEDWQGRVIQALSHTNLLLINPRRAVWTDDMQKSPYLQEQIQWELASIDQADHVIFCFVPDTLSPITMMELGLVAKDKKALVYCPEGFWRKANVDVLCQQYEIPTVDSLDGLIEQTTQWDV